MERDGVHAISIWGEKGSGKTFLARWIYREAMYLGFDTRAWVLISASMDQQEFFFEILKQVEKRARGMMNIHEIKKMLAQKLANTKKFLIVLDDMCPSNEEFFGELMMIIQPSSLQGHIIITTKDGATARNMSDDSEQIELKKLCDKESGRMLEMKLHGGCHVPSLTDEDKILNRIPALPLCISLLSGLLSNAKEQGLTALMNDKSEMSLSDLLELSYHRLPFHLKPCFIYMALFPVAFPIPTRRLVRLWLAEGLLVSHCYDGERKMTPEKVGEIFILELVDRNVIDVVSWRADGSPKACQMLTSLYELICLTMISTGFLHVRNNSNLKGRNDHNPSDQQEQLPDAPQEQTKVRWLAEHTNIVREGRRSSYPNLNLSHIRSFLSFYLRRGMLTRDIRTFLGNMTSDVDYSLLRVLDLEGVYKPSLQGMLSKLVLLRYLGLRSTVLDLIPSEVADLHYLETLDIKHTNVTSLPNSLWKARNLRHLHLNWFYIDLKKILKICGDNVMALNKIQTLSGLVICEVKENSLTGYMNSLTTLSTLKLFLQHSGEDTSAAAGETVARWISSSLTNLQSLTFGVIQEAKAVGKDKPPTSRIGLLPELGLAHHNKLFELYLLGQLKEPIWTKLLSVSLRVLTLSGSNVKPNMMPALGSLLKNLRTFRLLANSFLDTSLKFVKDGFQSLVILKIWNLPHLKEVIIEPGAIPHLKELEFRQIKGLETVRGIKECEELENICVIYQSDALVDQLKGGIGENTNLCVIKDTRGPDPQVMTKTDGDGEGKMMHPLCEKDTTRPGSADDDHGKLWAWLKGRLGLGREEAEGGTSIEDTGSMCIEDILEHEPWKAKENKDTI